MVVESITVLNQTPKHRVRSILLVISTVLAAGVTGAYAYLFYGDYIIDRNPLKSTFEVLYLQALPDQTVNWYDYEKGWLTKHAAPAPGTITGVTRANSATFFSIKAPSLKGESSIYKYANGSYELVYQNKEQFLSNLSASKDATSIGFVESSQKGMNRVVYNLATKTRTELGTGAGAPQFLSVEGVTAILYPDGLNVVLRYVNGSQWSEPQILFTSLQLPIMQLATNGKDRYAFTDVVNGNILVWQITSLTPLKINPIKVYVKKRGIAAFGGEKLYTYQYGLPINKSQYSTLQVTEIATDDTLMLHPARLLGSNSAVFLFAKP